MNLNTLNIGLVVVYQTHLPKVKGFKSHPIYFYCCMKVLANLGRSRAQIPFATYPLCKKKKKKKCILYEFESCICSSFLVFN